MSLDK